MHLVHCSSCSRWIELKNPLDICSLCMTSRTLAETDLASAKLDTGCPDAVERKPVQEPSSR